MIGTPVSGFISSLNMQKEKTALKLTWLKDKSIRYKLREDFWNRCLAEKLIPKGLRLEFVDTWYAKLKSFSITLVKKIASYCDKTIAQTKHNIRETETDLKSVQQKRNTFWLKTNEPKTKHFLHQRKFKKFNNLKYKRDTARGETQPTKKSTAFNKSCKCRIRCKQCQI